MVTNKWKKQRNNCWTLLGNNKYPTRQSQNKIMKKTFLFFFTTLFTLSLMAQGGVQFDKGTWAEMLEKAKAEDKLIFLDAYTTWCGPCKKMTRDIFPDQTVGEFFNKNFINVKMDMEKGEGIKIGRDYNINAYPTLIFIDGNGKMVHRAAGYHTVDQFIELGTAANSPEGRLSSLEKRYQDGDRDPKFLRQYTQIRYDAADGSHDEIALAYLNTQKDWGTAENKQFLFNYISNANTPMFDYLLDNKEAFAEMFGQESTMGKIQEVIYASIEDTKEDSGLEQVQRLFKKAYPEKADQMSGRFEMIYYRQAGDREKYMDAAKAYYDEFKSDDQAEYNETAWTFYKITEDKDRLKYAVKLAKKSVKLDKNYYNVDTMAHLYHALGKKRKAKKCAKKAIELAKASELDYQPTEKLLEEIAKL